MGIRKTIYVPDEATWMKLADRAKAKNVSVSQLLLNSDSQLDRIEEKLDRLLINLPPTKFDYRAVIDGVRKINRAKSSRGKEYTEDNNSFFNPMPKSGKK